LKTIGFTLTMLVAGANFDTRLQLANWPHVACMVMVRRKGVTMSG
jgi:hypothetical protein